MAEFVYYEDFECEEREDEIVQELLKLKFGIYGKQKQTTLDGIFEETEKNSNGTKVRVADFRTLFGDEENTDENRVVPGSSNEILASRNDVNMEDLNVTENTTSMNDSLHALACEMDDAANKDLPKVEKNTSHAMSGTVGEPSKETTLDVCPSSTYTLTTVHSCNKATLHVSLPTLDESVQHGDTRGERKPDATSSTDTSTTVHGVIEATVDVSFPTTTEPHNEEVQTAPDVEGEHKPVPDGLSKDSEVETVLVSDERGEIESSDSNSENKFRTHLVDAHGVKNECSDADVSNDGCSLPSCSGPTEWQNTHDLHSSGAEAISTQVSIAGCPPECEEPRSACENSVKSSEQVSHAPSTSIIEDGTKVAGKEGFQKKIEDGEIGANDSSLKDEDEQENGKCKPKKKSKEKKKAKVHKKEKCSKDGKTKKFHRRLVSLFCCCFTSQGRNGEKDEMEQSTTEDRTHCEDTSQRHIVRS